MPTNLSVDTNDTIIIPQPLPSSPSFPGIDTCLPLPAASVNHTSTCAALESCTSCVSTTSDCVWCPTPSSPGGGGGGSPSGNAGDAEPLPVTAAASHSAAGGQCQWKECNSKWRSGKAVKGIHRLEECIDAGLQVWTPTG